MNWLWVFVSGAIGMSLAQLVLRLAERDEARFYADPVRTAAARAQLERRAWAGSMVRLGAAAQILSMAGGVAVLALLLISLVAGTRTVTALTPFGIALLVSFAVMIVGSLLALPAVFFGRCQSCLRYVFDARHPKRKSVAGAYHENLRILRGRGRCPHCDTPLP